MLGNEPFPNRFTCKKIFPFLWIAFVILFEGSGLAQSTKTQESDLQQGAATYVPVGTPLTALSGVTPQPRAIPLPTPLPVPKPKVEELKKEEPILRKFFRKQVPTFFKKTEPAPPPTPEVKIPERPPALPLVITPTRTEEPLNQIGRSLTLITADDIEAQGIYTLSEALRNVPGVRVQTLGPVGDFTKIRIRGTRQFDTAVLIDGMPVRDASDTQGSMTPLISELFVDNLQAIEVLRGTGSTLYGSEAIGGVVHLRMKEGVEGRPRAKVTLDAGSYATHREMYQLSGGAKGFDYFLSYGHVGTDGIRGPDSYGNHSFGVNVGYEWEEDLEFRFILNSAAGETDLNDGPTRINGVLIQDQNDPNHVRNARMFHYNGLLRHRLNDHLEHQVRLGVMDSDRRFVNGRDTVDTVFSDSQFDGNISNVEYQTNLMFNEHFAIVSGLEHEREEFTQFVNERKDKVDEYRFGFFIENRLSFLEDTLHLSVGGRLNHHERSHTNQTGEISGSYLFRPSKTRIKGHVGTGFRDPSLFELFGRSLSSRGRLFIFGNPDLKPEESLGWDLGVEQKFFKDTLTLGGTFFKTEYSKRIDFVGSGYKQVAGGYSQGAELEALWRPIENLKLAMSYTRTFAEAGGRSITGIPRNLWGLNFDWKFLNRFRYNLDLTHKGDEQISIFSIPSFTSELIDQDKYTKVDMKLGFDLNDALTVWVRADNLFDAEIVEDGFRNPGTQFFGGVSMEV